MGTGGTIGNVAWSRQRPAHLPPARQGSSMAYDAARQVTMLFGGSGLNDTWTWDGTTWTQQQPALSPSARSSAIMISDASRATIVLFGGIDGGSGLLGDTWLWDGTTWVQRQPTRAPLPRIGASIAYDAANQRVVLFGGLAQGNRVGTLLHDTWTWDGTTWTQQVSAAFPQARQGAACAYDARRQRVLLFGGTAGGAVLHDTWAWNGSAWTQLAPTNSPSARAWACMSYHDAAQQIVLVGGAGMDTTALSDTWTWDGTTWTQTPGTFAPTGGYQNIAYDAARQVIIVYAVASQPQHLPTKSAGGASANILVQPQRPTMTGEVWTFAAF